MIHSLRSAVPAIRPSTSVLRTSTRATPSRSSCGRMSSAAALSVEEPQCPSFDLNILDIFDAPSRLGESSRLLVSNAAASSTIRRARLRTHVSTRRQGVKPLPEPVVLDGPARPRNAPFVSFRAFGLRANAGPRRNVSTGVWSTPASLPPPIVFDGPSQLRPYTRGGARWNKYSSSSSSLAMSAAPIVLALAAGVALFAIDITPAAPKSKPDLDSDSTSPASSRGRITRDRLSYDG